MRPIHRCCTYIFVILTLLTCFNEGGRGGGGGGRSGGGGSRSSHSWGSRPSHSWGSRPSSSWNSHPSPSWNSHPSPSARPAPRPIGWDVHPSHVTSRPISGSNSHPALATKSSFNVGNNPRPTTSRPIGWDVHSTKPTSHPWGNGSPQLSTKSNYNVGSNPSTSRPIGWDVHSSRPTQHPWGGGQQQLTTKSTYNVGSNPNYNTHNDAGWNLPPRPGSQGHYPQGPPQQNGYHPYQQYPQSSYSGPTKVKIVNKYNYHYPGYYSLPMQHSYYPGYYHTPTYYNYGSSDTGSGALGFFLGYSLGKLTTPTYSHQSFYDGYRPRYDHYEVHHYYHNRDSIPQNQEIRQNTIVGCVGDSTTVCPANTISLCTSNGALMCVVSATSTTPCTDNNQVNCVKSVVPCVNNTIPGCQDTTKNSTEINIPCVSSAKIYGDLKFVNNTIIVNAANNTNGTTTTTTPKYSTIYPNSTEATVTTTPVTVSTKYPITTTPGSSTQYPITTTPQTPVGPERQKREIPQNFCVTVVALPAKKKLTEGEKVFGDAKNLVSKFFEKAWGL